MNGPMNRQIARFDASNKTWLGSLAVVLTLLALAWHALESEPNSPASDMAIAEVTQHAGDTDAMTDLSSHVRPQSHETIPASQPNKYSQQRAFSFHYLDILEWLFASKRDVSPPVPHRSPTSTLAS